MLLIFEDEYWHNFAPLVYTRPVFDLRCGAFTLRERLAAFMHNAPTTMQYITSNHTGSTLPVPPNAGRLFPHNTLLASDGSMPHMFFGLCRSYLMDCYGPAGGLGVVLRESEPLTLVNGRAFDITWLPDLLQAPVGTVYTSQGMLLGARLSPALASVALFYLRDQQSADALAELQRFGHVVEQDTPLCTYPWELVQHAGEQLLRDMPLLTARLPRYTSAEGQVVLRGEHIYAAPSAQLDGPLVLDARDGPIFIDDHAHIEPFSFIQGPAYIGKKALISSALIRGETSIGPVCRIGGEVEASTIQGYTNKHHEGFLGHSWLGEWVNIGAMTTTSDLKNTYGSIKVALEQHGVVDSGLIKLGCFLADHVKLGIGLHLTGGAVIGTGSNLFGVHMTPKTVPPFTWGSEVFFEYQIERMIAVAQKVMSRRKLELAPAYEAMLRVIFAMTRSRRGMPGSPLSLSDTVGQNAKTLELLALAEAEAVRAYDNMTQTAPR